MDTQQSPPKRRPVNLTVNEDILKEAKELKLNTSQAAEDGIATAVKKAKETAWLEENRTGIEAHNKRVREHGLYIKPYWMSEE